ncbi:MAG: Histidine kinase [Nitrospira sp.]|nr:MAG: Histidine kinase [Nitrospira sp.]
MQIEWYFLHSRVARRVFFLFILCALLPVAVLSLVALEDVTGQLTQQSERRVRQESKAMGMAVYQRLLLLEAELLSISRQPRATTSHLAGDAIPVPPLPSTPGFTGMARLSADGTADVFLGEMPAIPSLSQARWTVLRQQKTVLVSTEDTGVRRIFLAHLHDSSEEAVLAEIRQEYVWDSVGSMSLPKDMFLCVFGAPTEVLFCSQPLSEPLQTEWIKERATGRASVFEWRDAEDSYIAASWEIPLRFQFSATPWTVVLSESQRYAFEPLTTFRKRFIPIVVIGVMGVALLSVIQIRKFMVPLEQLAEGTRRIAARNFSTPVRVQSGDEFEKLAAAFNEMATRLNQQFTQLATIHEIDRSVLSVLDPSRIVDTVLTRLREVSPCEGIAVLLMDSADSARGWLYARAGIKDKQTTMTGVPVTEEERRMLASHEGSITVIGVEGAGAFASLCEPEAVALMVLPLFRSRDLLGGIAMSYRRAPEMDAEHKAQLRQLADQVAVALSNASDLAERKRAETSLRESHARLEQTMSDLQTAQQQMVQQERLRALGQMASGIAHDFNNTLSPIMGFSELLLIAPQMSADPAQLKEYLQTINMAAKDAAKVVSRLREFYRPRLDADLAGIVDLNRLVEQSVKLSQPKWKDQALANGAAIEIKTELASVSPVAGHESELREVLTNLIFNAVDAMPKSGSITLRTKADGDHVRLEVSDTGMGMTEEVRRRCLEPFFSTKGEKGSGLGLAMVYGIIKRLRGTIDISSAVGVGTTFSIRLPIQAGQEAGNKQEGNSLAGVRLRVLVVDDDPLVGRVTGEYLRVAGHQVEVVTSATEAVKRFNPERVHLVVTDHGMPHMTGRQLAEVIKQVSPETPVVLLTGGDEIEVTETASSAIDAELCKPLTMAALQRTLSTLSFPSASRAASGKEIGDAA